MATGGFDYDTLSNRLRKEAQTAPDRLSRLEGTFYTEADQYVRHLAHEAHKEGQSNAASARATLLLDELRNARRALEDFYDLREHKILLLAASAARGAQIERTGMTKGEAALFDQLVRLLRDGRRTVLRHGERLLEDEDVAPPAAQPAQETPPAKVPERPLATGDASTPVHGGRATAPAVQAAPQPEPVRTNRVKVRVLGEVAPFTASDLRTYRLAPEDVVALPKEAAKALVLRGKATYVTS